MTSRSETRDIHQSLQLQPGLEQLNMETKVDFRAAWIKRFFEESNPEHKLFFILPILSLLRMRAITQPGSMFRACV